MITKYYNIFNYGSIILVFGFLVLMFTKSVPENWFMPLLFISIGILLLRIILRVYVTRQAKKSKGE